MRLRRQRPPAIDGLAPGERVLATADGPDGEVAATTHRLLLRGTSVEWARVETAAWDGDAELLVVTELPDGNGRRRRHRVALESPRRLVDVVREQVTQSVVISRHVAVDGRRGVRVTGRRTPSDEIVWTAAVDSGIDLRDPGTKARVDAAVALVRNEVE
ncbi:hypothetical protein E1262_10910 [Jiangella aurantiaca]|uniref:Uncharacterized protein n=1 Tax=Jiangella aurantiaca TaxID=2530373 RepID=A0A4R5ACA7_9ACTN|nr:hypothetical protein [Jiangella aurantiaca]TDD70068.1 hypothetical protein E1262_10910 [Jiangella aurantiaca]